MSRPWQAALLAGALLPAALAAERNERTFPASADSLIEVRNQTGRVVVRGWDQPRVRVVSEQRSRATEVHLEPGGGGRAVAEVVDSTGRALGKLRAAQPPSRLHVHTHVLRAEAAASELIVDYEIWIPADASLDIHLDVGQVEVEGLRDAVKIETMAASVAARGLAGTLEVATTSGDVVAENCGGRIKVESVSGNLSFADARSHSLDARSASGYIRYVGDLLAGGSYEFSNHQGAIELVLPADASFELTARSVHGSVSSAFPLTPKSHGRLPAPSYAHSLLGTVQSGAALIRASSFSGTITIGKR